MSWWRGGRALKEVDGVDLADFEFGQACEHCRRKDADWAIWATHGRRCREISQLLCDKCKRWVEDFWVGAVAGSDPCVCGWRPTGEFSDNFRAIRL